MKPLDRASRHIVEEASAADVPADDVQAKIWDALASRLDAPLPPMAAAASQALDSGSLGGLLSSVSAKWLISSVLTGALLVGGTVWYADSAAESRAADRQQAPPPTPQTVRALPVPSEPPPSASEQPTPHPEPAAFSFAEETRLIAEAQRALSSGTPSKTLFFTEQHRRRFPHGALAQERDAARVFALCRLGRTAEALREQQRFMRNWPNSPLATRVRTGCE